MRTARLAAADRTARLTVRSDRAPSRWARPRSARPHSCRYALHAQFALLTELNDPATAADLRGQVDILNVDRLAYQIVARSRGSNPSPIDGKDLINVWAGQAAGTPFSPAFLEREWRQVILAQDLRDEQAYLTCSRAGQGTPLGKAQRRQVWQVAQQVVADLHGLGRDTFEQLADEAARVLAAAPTRPYRHVIVDEAQDLHPAQWRLLRTLVQNGPDDLFLVGDPHQRIYDNRVSLAKMAINVRGRSKRLTVNYRTTQEILALAVPALGKGPIAGLDDNIETLDGYRSPLHGRRPKVIPARTREAEPAALIKQVAAGSTLESSRTRSASRPGAAICGKPPATPSRPPASR